MPDPTDLLPDTWAGRDFPLLREAARRLDARARVTVEVAAMAAELGLGADQADVASAALRDGGYWSGTEAMGKAGPILVSAVTEKARRAVGLWPTDELAADRLLAALDAAIQSAPAGEQQTRLRQARDGLVSAGRTVLLSVVSGVLTGQLPGH